MFIIIDPLSVNNDIYFKADGTTTKDEKEALRVPSVEEGDKICWKRGFTLYQPIYKPL